MEGISLNIDPVSFQLKLNSQFLIVMDIKHMTPLAYL